MLTVSFHELTITAQGPLAVCLLAGLVAMALGYVAAKR